LGKGRFYFRGWRIKEDNMSVISERENYYFIDTHAHLDMLKKITPEFAVKQSMLDGVRYMINVGSSLAGSRKALEYSKQFENVYASVGIHPHYADSFDKKQLLELESMIENSYKIVAVGEAGFDYFRNLSSKENQRKAFVKQIEIALKYKLPLIVHDRDAHDDIMDVLKDYANASDFRAVVHCFSGDAGFASKCLDYGFYISFTGVITFPNAKKLAETVREVPIEKIFLETDSPFLAPQEKRGQENYPGYVKYIAYKIAEIKEMTIPDVANITSGNAEEFFGIT